MSTQNVAQRYVELCKAGRFQECFDELFAKDAVSVEAVAPPGGERTTTGLEAVQAKSKQWANDHVVHQVEVSGPFLNGDRFAVRFLFDVTNKPSGKRLKMEEIGLFSVNNDKITREEFFYGGG